jgi:hypothetical protein
MSASTRGNGTGPFQRESNIRGKKLLQCSEIAFLGGGDEGIEKAPSLGRTHGRPRPVRDTFPGAGDELPGVRFTGLKDVTEGRSALS